jgi:TonB family protein
VIVLRLDQLAPPTPRLPARWWGNPTPLAVSAGVHLTLVALALAATAFEPAAKPPRAGPTVDRPVRHLVFLAPELPVMGGGGGGGGNRQPDPIRRAEGMGTDRMTLRVQKPRDVTAAASVADTATSLPSLVLEAKPLASGFFDALGLPAAVVASGTSTGPGSGGGVGTGTGSGIGSGHGPGLGPGSGGGTGGGVYRAGGAVSAPRLIKDVKPRYTGEALVNKIQGTVVLEAVVTADGCPSQIRVVRSLSPGLDQEAIATVAQWRFEPGRLAGEPVDVLVSILIDFSLR